MKCVCSSKPKDSSGVVTVAVFGTRSKLMACKACSECASCLVSFSDGEAVILGSEELVCKSCATEVKECQHCHKFGEKPWTGLTENPNHTCDGCGETICDVCAERVSPDERLCGCDML